MEDANQKNPQYWDDDKQIRERQNALMAIRIPKKRDNEERQETEPDPLDRDGKERMRAIDDEHGGAYRHRNFTGDDQDGGDQKRMRVVEEDILSPDQLLQLKKSIENCKNLPIAKHRNQILKKLERSRVLIISGDTGCGKTTQVPKYLLEHGSVNGIETNIICTQPRRIAASNIAKRVAMELGERVGGKVGYQVGMESRASQDTRIMFMTTGIFLMRLVNNPDSLAKYTHIIMDEVHERDLDTDFSLVVLKHLLGKKDQGALQFKLILMSATFNTQLFANYFSRTSIAKVEEIEVYKGVEEQYAKDEADRNVKLQKEWGRAEPGAWDELARKKTQQETENVQMEDSDEWVEEVKDTSQKNPVKKANDPAEIVEINARLFKVTEFYVDQIIKNIRQQASQLGLTAQDKELLHEAYESFHTNKPSIKEGLMRVASILICDIIDKQNTFNDDLEEDKRGILVFLPGLHEIFEFIDFIRDFYPSQWLSNHLELIPLHSSLSQDEQDKAFRNVAFMKGKRKVIIATNIAESSITIPDIKYVIDFMLTKELYYDPVSKSESLQLHYSSKASSKQRGGRAGRVQDGFVFRMCSQAFFENGIPEYPKPEMQRCPLEKLILQVKLWGSYEPEQILGRAIQPPEFRDICNAIKNLQQTGALTLPPPFADKSYVPKITALGKIFVNLPCDLKITRLFLLGMVLKCMHQAIIMGSIHSQTRSIFRGNRNIDQINMTKLQCAYDERRDSDSIMLLKVYNEWQRRWHPDLAYKEDDNKKPREERQQRRFGGRRIQMRISQQERKWCSDKSLDVNILRETAFMVDEIKHRFLRMNISEKCLNSRVRTGEEYPDGDLILKTCIGGAFYNKYIKAQYKNGDMLNRMKSDEIFQTDEHQRVLILNKVSDYITQDHLRQFFETKFKVKVQCIKLLVDKPIVIFEKEILESGYLKACFKLGTRNRQSRYQRIEDEEFERKQKFRSSIMSDGRKKAQDVYFSYEEVKEKLECEELRRPNFLYELRFETLNGENYVDFDMDSINNFTYELDTLNIDQVTFACYDYHDKGGRFLCRSGTRLPGVPMVDVLFCLVFAPMVQVMADEQKKFFNKVICDGGELVLNLTHVLTHHDLEIIQRMRNMLNETLCNEDNIKQAHMASVDFYMKKLLSFQRLSLDIYIKLQALREEDETDDRLKFLKKLKDDKSGHEEENFFLEEELQDAKNGTGYEEMRFDADDQVANAEMEALDKLERQNHDSERGYFLQPIYAQKIDKKIYLYDKVVSEMKEEFRDRLLTKRRIIEKMKHKAKELSLKDVTLLCDKCQQEVSLLKTVKFLSFEQHHAKCIFGHLRRVEIEDVIKNNDGYYSDQDNKDFIDMHLEIFNEKQTGDVFKTEQEPFRDVYKTKANSKFAFCECRNHHIVGFIEEQKFYFTDVSPLKMMFPQGHYEDWSAQFWSPGYFEAFELQSKLNIKRAQENTRQTNKDPIASEAVACELCNIVCRDSDEFILHCQKAKSHISLIKQFTDEAYDQIFEMLDKHSAEYQAKADMKMKE